MPAARPAVRRTLAALAVVMPLAVPLAASTPAHAVLWTNTATISPSQAAAGSTQAYTVTVTNTSAVGLSPLASARVVVPNGWTLTSAPTAAPAGWTATRASDGSVCLSGNAALQPGEQALLGLTARAPLAAGTSTWTTTPYTGANCTSSLLGDVFPYSGTQPTVTVSTLQFSKQPSNVMPYAVMGPVTVTASDATFSGPVTLELVRGAGSTGVLGGTATRNAVKGVATFNDLSVNEPGTYRLQTSGGSAQSNAFTVGGTSTAVTPCNIGATCQVEVRAGLTSARITADAGPKSDVLWATTGGVPRGGCVGTLNGEPVQFNADNRSKTGELLYDGDGNGTTIDEMRRLEQSKKIQFPVCFRTDGTQTFKDASGKQVTEGILPACPTRDPLAALAFAPCQLAEHFRSSSGKHDVLSVVVFKAGDPAFAH